MDIILQLKQKLHLEVKRRFANMEHNYFLSVSTLLDPRFKKIRKPHRLCEVS